MSSCWLVTYEWISYGAGSSKTWKRENEVICICPAIWWRDYLASYDKLVEKAKVKFKETGLACDRPPNESHRFLYATPISEEGFNALDGVVG